MATFRPSYENTSPYGATNIVGRYLTYYIHRRIAPHEADRWITIGFERYVHAPDLLALDFYGSEDLWWVIPVRNGLQDPVFDLQMEKDLIIPDPAYVRSII